MSGPLILWALAFVLISFVLTTVEVALIRMSRTRAAELHDEGRGGAVSLQRIMADSAPYLAVVTFLRVLAEGAMAVFVALAVVEQIGTPTWAIVVSILVLGVISFVVVGVSPRTLGAQHADRVALMAAPAVVGMRTVLGPVARFLVLLGNAVTPGKGFRDGPFHSESELRDLVDLASDSDVIEDDEREMIQSVFDLSDTVAREVMVPRIDMVTIDHDKTLRQAMSLFLRSGFSRIPVVGEDSDDVLGLLYFKDVTRRTIADPATTATSVTTVMRPMPFVPDSKPVDDLLREMQRDQLHFAIVVDEYGGTAGLVTIEDILEEIVGEIADEYDREAPGVEDLGEDGLRIPATMHVDDFAELFDVRIDEDEVDTVGGLLAKLIGQVPIVGSSATIGGVMLTAEKMAGRRHRIATLIALPNAPAPEPVSSTPAPRGEHG